MPTQSKEDRVELLIDGKAHQYWERYSIRSHLLIPADDWSLTVGLPALAAVKATPKPGQDVVVRVGGERVLVGVVDDVRRKLSKREHSYSVSGRDLAGQLVDCSAPVLTRQMSDMAAIIKAVVTPFGITRIDIRHKGTLREKISIEPCDTAWAVVQRVAEANGLAAWFTPDGVLVIGGPDYDAPPVGDLIVMFSGDGNNVEELEVSESIHDRFSEVTVLGQGQGTVRADGKHAQKSTARDTGLTRYRPRIVTDHEADTPALARARARKLLADGRLSGLTIRATVHGHRVGGKLWEPGQRVRLVSEPHDIDGVFFIIGRDFMCDRQRGTQTVLELKEDRVWVPEVHAHKKSSRKGKHCSPDDGVVVDLTKGK